MSSAFDHRIVVMSEPARRELATWLAQPREIWQPWCKRGGCDLEPRYAASYCYVTGRAGRVTSRVEALCEEHGRRFAARTGLELPELPARATLTIVELDAQFGTDNAGELEGLAAFQSALRKAFKP